MPNPPCEQSLTPQHYDLILVTSDITSFDGNFTCVSLPISPSLNDALTALDAAICAIPTPPSDAAQISYSGDTIFTCFTLSGTTVEDVLEEIATQSCVNATNITNLTTTVGDLCTDDIDLCGMVWQPCFGGVYTNLTDLLNEIMLQSCKNTNSLGGFDSGGVGLPAGSTGKPTVGAAGVTDLKNLALAMTRMYGTTTGGDLKYYGGVESSGGGSLNVTIDDGIGNTTSSKYLVNGWSVYRDQEVIALPATQDHYLDVTDDGTYLVTSLALASPAPPVSANAMRLYKFVTDGVGVTSVTDLAIYDTFDGTTFADDSIKNRHIEDLAVDGAKLETLLAADSWGSSDFITLAYDTKGRITSSSAKKFNITALTDGDVLMYDLAGDEWLNTPLASTTLPIGTLNQTLRNDGGAWVVSNNLINTGSNVGINIPAGLPLQDLTIGFPAKLAFQLRTPNGMGITTDVSGSLSGTYYYAVEARDKTGKTILGSEVVETVDGVILKSLVLSWNISFLADKYRVYRGTVSGTYVEYYDTTSPSLVDDGVIVWTATANPTHTDTSAYAITMQGGGIGIGTTSDGTKPLDILAKQPLIAIGINVIQNSAHDISSAEDKYGIKVSTNIANIGQDNYGGWFEGGGGDSNNYALYAKSEVSSVGDNYGLSISVANAGAGDSYIMSGNDNILIDSVGRTAIADGGSVAAADSVAVLELQSTTGGFVTSRMTAAQGSALAAINGLIIYATDTDATFTSVGFWGYEAGVWIKL